MMPRPAGGAGGRVGGVAGIVVLGVIGAVVFAIKGGFGGSNVSAIQDAFRNGLQRTDLATDLCGGRVASATGVSLSNVQLTGSVVGDGSATVTATPIGGSPGTPTRCTANTIFHYTISHYRSGNTNTTNCNVTQVEFFQPLTVGTVVNGTINPAASTLANGRPYTQYGLRMTAGQTVTMVVRGGPASEPGTPMDPLLVVFNNMGTALAQNDDLAPGSNLNSRVVFTATVAGTYLFAITTAAGDTGGPYQIQTWAGAVPTAL